VPLPEAEPPRRPPVSAADRAGMAAALHEAEVALAAGEVPVGCAIVRDGVVLATGRNETGRDPLAHAEVVALQALRAAGQEARAPGTTLYVTLEPCAMCAGAMLLAKVPRVVFGAWEPKTGMAGSVGDLLRDARLPHRCEVLGGVEAGAAEALMRGFFAGRRGVVTPP